MPDGDPTPDYDSRPEAIRRAIETRILDGKMRPGDRLGLKSELQKEFDVAGPTIAQALTLLTNDGLISMRRGRDLRRTQPAGARGDPAAGHGTAQSLAENIELREQPTRCWPCRPGGRKIGPRRAWPGREIAAALAGAHPVVRDAAPDLVRLPRAGRHGRQRAAATCTSTCSTRPRR